MGPDNEHYDIFGALLVLHLPFLLVAGLARSSSRPLRGFLLAASTAAVIIAVLPWPRAVDTFGHSHLPVLVLFALSAAIASLLESIGRPRRTRLRD